MNQSSFIAGTIAIAFLIFITVRGELPKYTAVLVGGSGKSGGETGSEKSAENKTNNPIDAANSKLQQTAQLLSSFKSIASV